MRYRLVPLIVVFALVLMGQSRPKQEAPAQHKDTEAKTSQPSAISPSPARQPTVTEQQNKTEQQPPKPPLLPVWSDAFWSNWALVVITGVAVYLARETLRDLKEQTTTAKTAADAAKDSADAALIGTRAWITFLLPEKPLVQKFKNGQPDGFQIVGCIKNVGKTPATVRRKFHFKSVVKRNGTLDLIPPYLEIEEPQTAYQMIPEAIEPAIVKVSESDMNNAIAGNLQIHILGQVVYEDVFGRPHETRYCFRYYPEDTVDRLRGFYPEGPDAYLKVN